MPIEADILKVPPRLQKRLLAYNHKWNKPFTKILKRSEEKIKQIFFLSVPEAPRLAPPFWDRERFEREITAFLNKAILLGLRTGEVILKREFLLSQAQTQRPSGWEIGDLSANFAREIIAHTEEKFWYWYSKGKLGEVWNSLRNDYFGKVRPRRIANSVLFTGVNWALLYNSVWFDNKVWASPDLEGKSGFLHGIIVPIFAPFPSPDPGKYPSVYAPPLHPLDRSLLFLV